MTGLSSNTEYAELLSNGTVRIKKEGVYDVRHYMVISDNAIVGDVYQFHVYRNGQIFSEQYSNGNGTTAAGSVAAMMYLKPGDIVSTAIAGVAHHYRVKGIAGHITIAPHVFY